MPPVYVLTYLKIEGRFTCSTFNIGPCYASATSGHYLPHGFSCEIPCDISLKFIVTVPYPFDRPFAFG